MSDKYCIISNLFGHYEYSSEIKRICEIEDVDVIILNGNIQNPYSRRNDLRRSLGSFLSFSKDIYVLPGKYEINNGFDDTVNEFKRFDNYYNGNEKRSVKLNNSQMIFLNSPEKIYNKKYNSIKDDLDQKRLEDIVNKELESPENTILISSYPKKFKSKNAFDYQELGKVKCDLIFEGEYLEKGMILDKNISQILKKLNYPISLKRDNFGSDKLEKIFSKYNIKKGISSYFYNSKNRAISEIKDKKIPESRFSEEFYYNPGSASRGEFGIIEVEKGKVRYKQYQI
ncbi:MAG: hypothetical protein ACOCRX_02205 [Candidatus Woesearchaeota archaeon]